MGNMASNEASSIRIFSSMAERLFCQHLLVLLHFCGLSSIAKEVENTSENRHWRFRIGPAASSHVEAIWTSTWSQSCSQMCPNLRPGCDILEPSWAEVGAKWVQVGPKLGPCWPKLTPSLADMLDRKRCIWTIWGQSAKCANYHSPVLFWRLGLGEHGIGPSSHASRRRGRIWVSMLQDPLSLALGPFRKDSQGKRPCECAVKKNLFFSGLASPQSLLCRAMASVASCGILRGPIVPPKSKNLTMSKYSWGILKQLIGAEDGEDDYINILIYISPDLLQGFPYWHE